MAGRQFTQLQGILAKMKVKQASFPQSITKIGRSGMFDYALDKPKSKETTSRRLATWSRLAKQDLDRSAIKIPSNGFEELIQLTEEGRLWKYPIDNEQGMEAEQSVPFEEHVFLDKHLEGFPDNEYIQQFMDFVTAGLARNNWMTVERKKEAIKFYKDYFESKRDTYKAGGFDL